ncbi:DUF4430 domain-containing protein [Candidatus Woesearchaeota archaeon]|nr:DUF4430 domain-containing protein [Candidatus Woesearchaeota archaeon]
MKRITLGIVALGLAACAPQALPVEPAPQAAIVMETPTVTETPEAVPTPTGMPLEVSFNFPAGQQDYQVPLTLTQGGDEFSAYHAFTRAAANESLALETQWFDFDGDPSVNESAWIDSVAGVKTSADWAQYWQFSVNNTPALLGVSGYVPQQGDVLSLDYKESPAQDALEWLLDHQEESGALGGNYFQHAWLSTHRPRRKLLRALNAICLLPMTLTAVFTPRCRPSRQTVSHRALRLNCWKLSARTADGAAAPRRAMSIPPHG